MRNICSPILVYSQQRFRIPTKKNSQNWTILIGLTLWILKKISGKSTVCRQILKKNVNFRIVDSSSGKQIINVFLLIFNPYRQKTKTLLRTVGYVQKNENFAENRTFFRYPTSVSCSQMSMWTGKSLGTDNVLWERSKHAENGKMLLSFWSL